MTDSRPYLARVLRLFVACVVLAAVALPAQAALLNPWDGQIDVPERGQDPLVYNVGGNRLGLITLRDSAFGDQIDTALFDSFTDQTVLGIYAGRHIAELSPLLNEFDRVDPGGVPFTLTSGKRTYRQGLWVLWAGAGDLIFDKAGQNAVIGGLVTRPGNPLIAVPLPAGVWMLLAALGGLGGLGWRQRRRAATA
ncbi:VPLPA-CTERM sorting domain-containing protein [Jannaschia ovalis]|uniref:VPLPA-CTERM sorting domain-containing protein n=1 Tax=Jannaschia ovalis TaxID=3038773 RepID=A0ABY8LE43_9RHOB|nr:VPLPA-CTERM sorting domain-containing protein [Jannaschia sp. GRR-S6-38]WGH78419.1 VPLPA-CTERM sorting domain-containing protein [Jannaschia sp. GRR-S6-38]